MYKRKAKKAIAPDALCEALDIENNNFHKEKEKEFKKYYLKFKLIVEDIPKKKLRMFYMAGRLDGMKYANRRQFF